MGVASAPVDRSLVSGRLEMVCRRRVLVLVISLEQKAMDVGVAMLKPAGRDTKIGKGSSTSAPHPSHSPLS